MTLLQGFDFSLDAGSIAQELRMAPGSDNEATLHTMIAEAETVGKPKALYTVAYVTDRSEDTVTFDGTTFTSVALRHNLQEVNRVFAFVATCGTEIDTIANTGDFLLDYWWRSIKMGLLGVAIEQLKQVVQNSYGIETLSMMNPGSGEASVWSIEQQPELFALLGDVEVQTGVQLTPSYLMLPEMTTSGILFQSDTTYHNCQLCQREDCPGRSAQFDPDMWRQVGK